VTLAHRAWTLVLVPLVLLACGEPQRSAPAPPVPIAVPVPAPEPVQAVSAPETPTRNLSLDESMGGHTLTRHVGKSDAQLRARLKRERQITSASTYPDRATAERAVGGALAQGGSTLSAWTERRGRRPNLVLRYADRSGQPLGRSIARGQHTPVSCAQAIVVLRWDERRNNFFVLTSYPEARR
jgi:hypothetical protein